MKPKSAQAHHEGTVEKLRALGSMDYHPEIKKRRSEFNKLVTKLSKDYQIGDSKVLGRAIDFAVRMYHDNDVLRKLMVPQCRSANMKTCGMKRIDRLIPRRYLIRS
jgi:hypothetical protein